MAIIEPISRMLGGGLVVTIRPLAPPDAGLVRVLRLAVTAERRFLLSLPEEVAGIEEITSDLEAHARTPNHLHLGAFIGTGALVGELVCLGGKKVRNAHVGTVGLLVAADHRSLGVGRALMEACLAWARANPIIHKLTLAVFTENLPARTLYTHLGFVPEGARIREAQVEPGVFADDMIMGLWVKP